MSRKGKQDNEQQAATVSGIKRVPFAAGVQWVASSLTADDKEWLRHNADNDLDYVGGLLGRVDSAFTLSIKPDDKSRRYNAVMLCTDQEHPGAGRGISCRGATATAAIYGLAYLVIVKFPDGWWLEGGGDLDDPWG